MHCSAKPVAMVSTAVFAVTAPGLVLLLLIGSLASDGLTTSVENTGRFDSTNGATGGRVVLECPGVCPACPGCPTCPSPPSCQRAIPPGYKYYEGFGYYQMHYEPVDWFHAKDACERTGGYLVVLNSQEEAKTVNKIMQKHGYNAYIHIGFYDILKNKTYVTVLGDLLSTTGYFIWGRYQPSHPGRALCGGYNEQGLDDVMCNQQQGFLCEL